MTRVRAMTREFLVLGYVAGPATKAAKKKMTELAVTISRLSGIDIAVSPLGTYDAVAQLVYRGELDLAWLPPVPYVALSLEDVVVPLASARALPYASAIVVSKNSRMQKPASLRAKRAAWVDRHSAAGFILPRIKLARIGMNPDGAFGQETFYGSHEAVVRAVAAGQADFGATWVQIDRGKIIGPWSRMANLEDSVRVLATFGNIPSDVLAARADVDKDSRKAIVKALKKIGLDRQARWIMRDLFGTESFFRPNLEGYASLHEAVSLAYRSGWLQPSTVRPDELDVAKTLEIRPRAAAMASRINPDGTDEAEVIEVIEPSNPGARPLEPLGSRWSE